jgi:hypothetical protein
MIMRGLDPRIHIVSLSRNDAVTRASDRFGL